MKRFTSAKGARYPHIFERLYGRPLLLLPEKAFTIERVFQAHLLGMSTEAVVKEAFAGDVASSSGSDALYQVSAGGVALIPVIGTLVQRSSFMDAMSGITSYGEIGFAFASALADPTVKGVLLEIDSGGGEVNGCFDLVDEIAASSKPVWAIANEAAYSAAYAIASAADRLFMPRTAGVGSIGVIALHVDESERDKKQGYSYTPIFAGDHKFDANSHEPLPSAVRDAIQSDIDRLYQLFVGTVASNRAMPSESVVATQADVFHTEAAIELGLADDAGTLDDVVNQFEEFLASPTIAISRMPGARFHPAAAAALPEGVRMDTTNAAAPTASITPEALAQATTAAANTAIANERTRVAAILNSEEAKDRGELASHLALESDMAADKAIALLAKSPKATPVAVADAVKPTPFEAAMNAAGNPNVRADDAGEPTDEQKAEARAQSVLAHAARRPAHQA